MVRAKISNQTQSTKAGSTGLLKSFGGTGTDCTSMCVENILIFSKYCYERCYKTV